MNYIDFFGTNIHWVCKDKQLQIVREAIASEKCHYITYSNVHVVVTSRKDVEFQEAINGALLASPDGMPLVKIGQSHGATCMEKCSGADMMALVLQEGLKHGYRHYFYGSRQETLDKLKVELEQKYPGIKIAGMYSPPYRELTASEKMNVIDEINAAAPDCIWVGLGAPKQEKWMNSHRHVLNRGLMFGVGAAFAFHAGQLDRAPEWMQKACLEWFYRLCKEPRRLWKRYLTTNTMFIWYLMRHGVSIKKVEDMALEAFRTCEVGLCEKGITDKEFTVPELNLGAD